MNNAKWAILSIKAMLQYAMVVHDNVSWGKLTRQRFSPVVYMWSFISCYGHTMVAALVLLLMRYVLYRAYGYDLLNRCGDGHVERIPVFTCLTNCTQTGNSSAREGLEATCEWSCVHPRTAGFPRFHQWIK